jgi:MoaA/NifB/PqqE/SkfB family radical SAM enzyme
MRHNEHQMEEAKQLAKSIGVDELKFKTVQVYDFEHNADLVPLNEAFSRYEINSANPSIKNKLLNHCWKLWHSCVMTWDGKIVPCCFDKDASHQLGDIKEKSFSAIWQAMLIEIFGRK